MECPQLRDRPTQWPTDMILSDDWKLHVCPRWSKSVRAVGDMKQNPARGDDKPKEMIPIRRSTRIAARKQPCPGADDAANAAANPTRNRKRKNGCQAIESPQAHNKRARALPMLSGLWDMLPQVSKGFYTDTDTAVCMCTVNTYHIVVP